jgi:hypothetical protein
MISVCTQFTDRECREEDCCIKPFYKLSEAIAVLRDTGVPAYELDIMSLKDLNRI